MHRDTRFTLHPLRRALRIFALTMPLGITGLAMSPGLVQARPGAGIPHRGGSLATVVSTFAAQSGVLLSAPAQGLEGRRSPGLQGRYTPADGFQQILQGSGLQAVRQADGSYRLESATATGVTSLSDTTVTGFALGNALGETDGYLATHSDVATKTSKGLLETSQSVSVVTREQIDDQGAKTVQQAMRYTPGIFTGQIGASNRYDYVVMRGFADNSVDNVFLDGLKTMGDSGTFSSLQVDPYFLERRPPGPGRAGTGPARGNLPPGRGHGRQGSGCLQRHRHVLAPGPAVCGTGDVAPSGSFHQPDARGRGGAGHRAALAPAGLVGRSLPPARIRSTARQRHERRVPADRQAAAVHGFRQLDAPCATAPGHHSGPRPGGAPHDPGRLRPPQLRAGHRLRRCHPGTAASRGGAIRSADRELLRRYFEHLGIGDAADAAGAQPAVALG